MPGKPLVWGSVMGAFVLPPYLGAIGWILLAGPNSGFINIVWRAATGARAPLVNVYTFAGLAFVIALHAFPLIFIFVKSALDLVSSEMEDAANILGAGTGLATRKVTLPLVWPSILGGIIIVFLETVSLFGTPAIIGIPARINVVTTQLWQFFEYPVRVEVAAAYAMPLLLITVAMLGLQRLMLARRGYVSQTGKGGERRLIAARPLALGARRLCAAGRPALGRHAAAAAPAGLVLEGLGPRPQPRQPHPPQTTASSSSSTRWRSPRSGTRCGTPPPPRPSPSASASSWPTWSTAASSASPARSPSWPWPPSSSPASSWRSASTPPMPARPSPSTAPPSSSSSASPPASCPSPSPTATPRSRAVHPEMEEAARILGSGRLRTVGLITAPLSAEPVGGWLIVFIVASRELSSAIFLVGPKTRTMAVLLYDLSEAGNFEQLAAFGGILLAITVILILVGIKLAGRDFMLRRV